MDIRVRSGGSTWSPWLRIGDWNLPRRAEDVPTTFDRGRVAVDVLRLVSPMEEVQLSFRPANGAVALDPMEITASIVLTSMAGLKSSVDDTISSPGQRRFASTSPRGPNGRTAARSGTGSAARRRSRWPSATTARTCETRSSPRPSGTPTTTSTGTGIAPSRVPANTASRANWPDCRAGGAWLRSWQQARRSSRVSEQTRESSTAPPIRAPLATSSSSPGSVPTAPSTSTTRRPAPPRTSRAPMLART